MKAPITEGNSTYNLRTSEIRCFHSQTEIKSPADLTSIRQLLWIIMRKFISYMQTSRKPTIPLGRRFCTIFLLKCLKC